MHDDARGAARSSGAAAGRRRAAALLLAALLLDGCASTLVAFESNAIEDDPGERTFYQRLADESIETKAIVNLHAADERFDAAHLVVQSYNGYVLLAGQVPDDDMRELANGVVRRIRDVRRIYNELEVAAASSAMTRAADTWIASKVKTLLLAGSSTPGLRVKVVAVNGVLYLLGMVTAEEADRVAATAAGVSGVQRVVRIFELIG